MKHFIKLFAYTFMFGISLIGYLCLPDMIKMWRSGCAFMSVTEKKAISESNNANYYSLEGNLHVWDRTNYETGDIVCVKKPI